MEEWRKIYFLEQVRGGWALLKNNTFLKGRCFFIRESYTYTYRPILWDENIPEYVQVRSMLLHILSKVQKGRTGGTCWGVLSSKSWYSFISARLNGGHEHLDRLSLCPKDGTQEHI